jgi:hypothetical protein
MTVPEDVPEDVQATLRAIELRWLCAIRDALHATGVVGKSAAVVRVEEMPADGAVLFVGSAAYARLTALREQALAVLAGGLTQTVLRRAADAAASEDTSDVPSRL